MSIRTASSVLFALLLGASCTVVKPIACGVAHPLNSVIALFEESSSTPEEVDDVPTAVALIELPIVLPVFFAYECCVGVIGGLGTGIVSDFNVVSGHASWDKTLDSLTHPAKTNAAR